MLCSEYKVTAVTLLSQGCLHVNVVKRGKNPKRKQIWVKLLVYVKTGKKTGLRVYYIISC